MKKILPLETPFISGFPATSTVLSILQHHTESIPWIFNNYIQLFSASPETNIDFFDVSIDNCPFLSVNTIDKGLLQENTDILEFILSALDRGYYLTFMVDTSKIRAYKHGVKFHDPLFYGYDSEERRVFFSEYLDHRRYARSSCSYEELSEAIILDDLSDVDQRERFEQDYTSIKLIRYDSSWCAYKVELRTEYTERFAFSPDRVCQSFLDYLSGSVTSNWFTRIPYLSADEKKCRYFGIGCYDLMALQLEKNWESGRMPDGMRQSYYVMYTHKMMQQHRIRFMRQNGCLRNGDSHLEAWSTLADAVYLLLLCVLKENLKNTFQNGRKAELLRRIDQLKERETYAVKQFLEDMRACGD